MPVLNAFYGTFRQARIRRKPENLEILVKKTSICFNLLIETLVEEIKSLVMEKYQVDTIEKTVVTIFYGSFGSSES